MKKLIFCIFPFFSLLALQETQKSLLSPVLTVPLEYPRRNTFLTSHWNPVPLPSKRSYKILRFLAFPWRSPIDHTKCSHPSTRQLHYAKALADLQKITLKKRQKESVIRHLEEIQDSPILAIEVED